MYVTHLLVLFYNIFRKYYTDMCKHHIQQSPGIILALIVRCSGDGHTSANWPDWSLDINGNMENMEIFSANFYTVADKIKKAIRLSLQAGIDCLYRDWLILVMTKPTYITMIITRCIMCLWCLGDWNWYSVYYKLWWSTVAMPAVAANGH